jgi:hypothetical protein
MKTGNGSILFLKRGYIDAMMDSGLCPGLWSMTGMSKKSGVHFWGFDDRGECTSTSTKGHNSKGDT